MIFVEILESIMSKMNRKFYSFISSPKTFKVADNLRISCFIRELFPVKTNLISQNPGAIDFQSDLKVKCFPSIILLIY